MSGRKRQYPWGDEFDNKMYNTDKSDIRGTTPVGEYSPAGDSPYDRADMAGNVWEWVADWYDSDYYGRSPSQKPQGLDSGSSKVVWGGSWDDFRDDARSAFRGSLDPSDRIDHFGFRCGVSSTSSL